MGKFKKIPDFFISLSFQDKAIIILTLFLGVLFGMYYGIAWWGNAKAGAIVGLVIGITTNLIILPLKNWTAGTASKIYGSRVAHWSLREQLEGDLNQAKHLKTQKKYDKALFVINNILKQDPEFPEALYIKAKIVWEGFENAESARANLKKVMDLTSNKNDTIYRWSSHLYDEITSMKKRPKVQPSINEK